MAKVWRISLLGIAVAFSGCSLLGPSTPGISVIRQTIDADFYASAQVLSPDPLAPHYPVGERLILSWSVPEEWLEDETLALAVEVYYRNRRRESFRWPITKSAGTEVLDCVGECFEQTKGWMTYNVELQSQGEPLLADPHQLWFRWIQPEE